MWTSTVYIRDDLLERVHGASIERTVSSMCRELLIPNNAAQGEANFLWHHQNEKRAEKVYFLDAFPIVYIIRTSFLSHDNDIRYNLSERNALLHRVSYFLRSIKSNGEKDSKIARKIFLMLFTAYIGENTLRTDFVSRGKSRDTRKMHTGTLQWEKKTRISKYYLSMDERCESKLDRNMKKRESR